MTDAIEFGLKALNGRTEVVSVGIDAVTKQQSQTSNDMTRILAALRNMREQVHKLLRAQDQVTNQYKRVDKIVLSSKPDDYVIHEYEQIESTVRVPRRPKSPSPEPELIRCQSPTPTITITIPDVTLDELYDDDSLSLRDEEKVVEVAALEESPAEQVSQEQVAVNEGDTVDFTIQEEAIEGTRREAVEVKTNLRDDGSETECEVTVAVTMNTAVAEHTQDTSIEYIIAQDGQIEGVLAAEESSMGEISEQEVELLLEEEEALQRKEEEEEIARLELEALREEEEELARLEEEVLRKDEEELARSEEEALRKEEDELARLEEEALREEEDELVRLEEEALRKEEEELERLEEDALRKEEEELEDDIPLNEHDELLRKEEEEIAAQEAEEAELAKKAEEEARKKEEEEKAKKTKYPALKKSPGKLANKFTGGKNRVVFK